MSPAFRSPMSASIKLKILSMKGIFLSDPAITGDTKPEAKIAVPKMLAAAMTEAARRSRERFGLIVLGTESSESEA